MIYLINDIYKEDNIRLVENSVDTKSSVNQLKAIYNVNTVNASDNFNNDEIIISKKEIIDETFEELPDKYLNFEVDSKLEIPKINLSTYVLKNYSEDAMNVCVTKLYGPNTNESGNYCIIGHNYQKENMFNKLIDLEIGDEIYLLDCNRRKYKYKIYDIYKVRENNIEPLSQKVEDNIEITLITCVNYTNNRLIVKARKEN